jgi:hypothetical protein
MDNILNNLAITNPAELINEINIISESDDQDAITEYINSYSINDITLDKNIYVLIFILLMLDKTDFIKYHFENIYDELPLKYILPKKSKNFFRKIIEGETIDNLRNYFSNQDNVDKEVKIFNFKLTLIKYIFPENVNINVILDYLNEPGNKEYIINNYLSFLQIMLLRSHYHNDILNNILVTFLDGNEVKLNYDDKLIFILNTINVFYNCDKIVLITLLHMNIEELNFFNVRNLISVTYSLYQKHVLLPNNNLFKLFINKIILVFSNQFIIDILYYFNEDFSNYVLNEFHNEEAHERPNTPFIEEKEEKEPPPHQQNQPQPILTMETIKNLSIKKVKYELLKRALNDLNTAMSNNLNDEEFINKLSFDKYAILVTFFNYPIKSKNEKFIEKCKTNTDLITGTDMDLKDDDIYPIGFMMEEDEKKNDEKKLHCFDKASLLRSFSDPMFIYMTNNAVYRLIYPMYWITQDALIKIILSDKHAFKLIKEGDHDLGTIIGVGNWHGGNIHPVYNVEELDLDL